jgi:F-type H+-transporting ATPase subunit b
VIVLIPDYTIFYQMVNFLVLIFVLNALLYKPVLGIIERRKKQLDELENEIKIFNDSVEKRVAEYEEKLKQAKVNASDLKKEIISEGSEQAKKIIDSVRNEIPAMTQEFQQKMGKEVDAARLVLQGQSRNLSLEIAQKVLGRPVQ